MFYKAHGMETECLGKQESKQINQETIWVVNSGENGIRTRVIAKVVQLDTHFGGRTASLEDGLDVGRRRVQGIPRISLQCAGS